MGEQYSEDDWREIATRHFARWEADRAAARDYVSAQSRWMIAQLFVANSGALAGLTAAEPLRPSLAAAGPWFVGGLLLAVLCGLATWLHAGWIVHAYDRIADPAMLVDRAKWPEPDPRAERRMALLNGLAVFIGVLSLAAFAIGALSIKVG